MDISCMLEVQVNEVKEMDIKENVTPIDLLPSTTNVSSSISQDERNFYKLMFGNDISVVRFRKLHCTACDSHIGSAPSESYNMFEHPVLHTLLCAKCRDFYGDGTFEQGDDATDMFCRWCANGGNLYCCSFCSNTFCYKCIKRNFDPVLRKKIEEDEKWKCFVCDSTDLYPARATCWALLQHIQSMNRMLQNNRKLTQAEIEETMNLDETECCPRKKKKKRRRTDSNSAEEDVTYIPKQITQTFIAKRKKKSRGKSRLSNGSTSPASYKAEENSGSCTDQNEILPSLFSCEQTMVECENATVNVDGTIVSPQQTNLLLQRGNSSIVQDPKYNTTLMNVVSTSNLLQPTSSGVPLRRVTGLLNRMKLYEIMHNTSTPMVAIPNRTVSVLNRSRISSPRSQIAPNIIEIESDSEEIAVVGPSPNSCSSSLHTNSNKAVPVALVSSKSNYDNVIKIQETLEKHNSKTLNQRILPHNQEINNVLTNVKAKLQDLFEVAKREEHKKYELNDARLRIKRFHREIRDTIMQLACINDRIVREYNKWKRYQSKVGTVQPSSESNNVSKTNKSEDVLLDMLCVNESDSDSENCTEPEEYNISSFEFVGTVNVVEGISFFRQKNTVDKAVGNDSNILADKSVQIYDVELQDYDKSIRHSVLNQQSAEYIHVPTSCNKEVKKRARNYEDEFLHYLQKRMKSQNIQTDESKDLPDPNETPLKDLIEANSPFISEMLRTMDKSGVSNDINALNICNKKQGNSKSSVGQETSLVAQKTANNIINTANNIIDLDINKKPTTSKSILLNEFQKESKSHKAHVFTNDDICVKNISNNNVQNYTETNSSTVDSEHNNEDDCTIIED